ncbi:MAG: hypothetical protein P0S96_05360 [Simkaniaceae bacterium]|nr:hypothetical protein [Candidatus Sacchlamyda saccharinae]
MEKYVEKSLETANLIGDKREKSKALANIAGRIATCTQEFDKALEIALSVPNEDERTNSLCRVAYAFLDRGEMQRALETVLLIPKYQDKFYLLLDISVAMKDEKNKKKFNAMIIEYLLKDFEKIADKSIADNCIDALARALIDQKDFDRALKLSELFYDLSKKKHLYYHAVNTYSSQNDFDKATELAKMISDKQTRDNCFNIISQDMIYLMKPEEETSDTKVDESAFLEFSEVALGEKVLQP